MFAAVVDAACIAVFVAAGRQSHDLSGGATWFVTVAWPFAAGWFAIALLARLYVSPGHAWLRLAVTWLGGVTVALVLRVVVTGRSAPPAFVVVAFIFLGATTAGWRLVMSLVSRRRGSRDSAM